MTRQRNAQEITRVLRAMDRDLAQGLKIVEVCRRHGVDEATYNRWRKRRAADEAEYARRYRELERELKRLKKLSVELSLDCEMLRELASRDW